MNDPRATPVDTATVFEAASLSKSVFAYLVLRLADQGVIDLDRPLYQMADYPRLAGDARARRITGRIVLSHATGLPNWGGERLATRFEPGTDYGYSGEGFTYLQTAVLGRGSGPGGYHRDTESTENSRDLVGVLFTTCRPLCPLCLCGSGEPPTVPTIGRVVSRTGPGADASEARRLRRDRRRP